MSVVMAQSLAELPEQAKKHFEGDIFSTLAWYRAVENAGLAPGESACFAVISRGDEVIAVVPILSILSPGRKPALADGETGSVGAQVVLVLLAGSTHCGTALTVATAVGIPSPHRMMA